MVGSPSSGLVTNVFLVTRYFPVFQFFECLRALGEPGAIQKYAFAFRCAAMFTREGGPSHWQMSHSHCRIDARVSARSSRRLLLSNFLSQKLEAARGNRAAGNFCDKKLDRKGGGRRGRATRFSILQKRKRGLRASCWLLWRLLTRRCGRHPARFWSVLFRARRGPGQKFQKKMQWAALPFFC